MFQGLYFVSTYNYIINLILINLVQYKIFHVHQEAFTERTFQRNLVLFRSNSPVSFLDFIFWAKNDKLHPSRLAKTVH